MSEVGETVRGFAITFDSRELSEVVPSHLRLDFDGGEGFTVLNVYHDKPINESMHLSMLILTR